MTRLAKLCLLLLLLIALSACATLRPQIERSRLQVAHIQIKELGLLQQRYLITLRAQNPNPIPLPIRGVSYALELEGTEFASGVTAAPFSLPAYGESDVQLELSTNLLRTGQWLLERLQRGDARFAYRVHGDINVDRLGIGRIPFDNHGEVDLTLTGARQ